MYKAVRKFGQKAVSGVVFVIASASTASPQEPVQAKQAEAAYRAGSAAVAKGDLQTALADFRQAVRLDPSPTALHSALGFVLLKLGNAQESVPEFQQVLRKNPADVGAGSNLALAYEQLGQPEKVVEVLARLNKVERAEKRVLPASTSALYARALAATHQIPAAITQMRTAVSADPHDAGLLDDLGSLYAMQQDWPNAERNFRAALSSDHAMASAHLHLGLALAAQQRPEGKDELAAAYRLAPENPIVDLEYGRSLAGAGDDDHAIPVLEKANELPRHPMEVTYQLALALQRAGRTDEAVPLYKTVSAAEPENADVLTNLGMALCQQKNAEAALPLLQKAVSLSPKNVTAREDLAAASIQLNQFDDAVVQLRAAMVLDPDSPQLHYNLGVAYKLKDDAADAIAEYEQAEKLDPHQPEAVYALGMLYMQSGRYEEASRELKAALAMQPKNGDGWATLGSVYSKLSQLVDAEAALRMAIAQLPGQPEPHLTLAAVLVKQGKPDQAAVERKTAADLMRSTMNRQRAEVATHSGESLLKSGDLAGAIVQFNGALTFDPAYRDAHAGLAKVYEAQGRSAEAAAERSKMVATTP